MITAWVIVLAIAVVLAVAMGVWVAWRKRTASPADTVRSQDPTAPHERMAATPQEDEGMARPAAPETLPCPGESSADASKEAEQEAVACTGHGAGGTDSTFESPAEPVEGANRELEEDLAAGEDAAGESPPMTDSAGPPSQCREELDGINDDGTYEEEWKQEEEAESTTGTLPSTDAGAAPPLPEEEVGEISICREIQDDVQERPVPATGGIAGETDSESEPVPRHDDEPNVPAPTKGPPTLPPPRGEDDKHAAPAAGAGSESETAPDAIPPRDEVDGDSIEGSSTASVLDEKPVSKLTPTKESPIPSAEGLAGDTMPDFVTGEDSQTNRERIGEQRPSDVERIPRRVVLRRLPSKPRDLARTRLQMD